MWTIELSVDTRKGRVIVEDGTFADVNAFDIWKAGDSHRAVANRMTKIADWLSGDWCSSPE